MDLADRRQTMGLLFSDEIKNELVNELFLAKSHLHIVSAYCKNNALDFIQNSISNENLSKKLLVRFLYKDIISGASDLSIYEFCKANGWQMYVRFDLHAKTYIFDKIRCIVGSANLTSKGISIINNPNYEIAMLTELSADEMKKAEDLFDSAFLMNDEIYSKMCAHFNSRLLNDTYEHDDWGEEILSLFKPTIKTLFIYEFPNCNSLSELKEDSLEFLGLSSGWNMQDIKKAFAKSNVYMWLVNKLKELPNSEIYFGALSAELHKVIINDPKPFRKEIKNLQSNLLNWIMELKMDDVIIDRPNHSQRIRFTGNN